MGISSTIVVSDSIPTDAASMTRCLLSKLVQGFILPNGHASCIIEYSLLFNVLDSGIVFYGETKNSNYWESSQSVRK